MGNVTNSVVLVLNASYEPLSLCAARRALTLIVKDAAVVQEHTGREVYRGIMFPSVIRLKRYAYVPSRMQVLTRKNILLRDRYQCQYCGEFFNAAKLTIDHIIPRAQGGQDTWHNLCCACGNCNRKKADRTPDEANMPLLKIPRPATIHTSRHILRSLGEEDAKWRKYLYY